MFDVFIYGDFFCNEIWSWRSFYSNIEGLNMYQIIQSNSNAPKPVTVDPKNKPCCLQFFFDCSITTRLIFGIHSDRLRSIIINLTGQMPIQMLFLYKKYHTAFISGSITYCVTIVWFYNRNCYLLSSQSKIMVS